MLQFGTPSIGEICDELARSAKDIADLDVKFLEEQKNPDAIRLSQAMRRQSELCALLARRVRDTEKIPA